MPSKRSGTIHRQTKYITGAKKGEAPFPPELRPRQRQAEGLLFGLPACCLTRYRQAR
jgi:hypothetical protein